MLSWNRRPVVTSEDLKINAQLAIPGSRAKLALVRDGKRVERDVVLRAAQLKGGDAAASGQLRADARAGAGGGRGLRRAGAAPARASGLPGGRGVVVTRVTDHGAADQAGLKVGDIVLRIGKASVRSHARCPRPRWPSTSRAT